MSKLSTGIIIGSLVGIAGIAMALGDKKNRHNLKDSGNKFINKASNMF